MKNLEPLFNTPPKFDISIYALEELTATIEYGAPAEPYYEIQTISIAAGEVGVISYDDDEFLNQENLNVAENRSFRITTDGDARVYAFHNRIYFAEASPILPTSALGEDYLVQSFEETNGAFPSLFSVIGTEDNTTVTIVPASSTPLGPAGDLLSVELDAGQVITISSSGDLTGSRVTSDGAPIAVFGGHQQSLIGLPNCGADSHLWEQAMPLDDWSTQFAVVPVFGNGGDLIRILSAFDGTEVYIDCELLTILDEGEYFDQFFEDPSILSSNQPIGVSAMTRGGDCSELNVGDPNMRIILPLERGNTGVELLANYGLQGGPIFGGGEPVHFLHLVMPTDDTGGLTVNGAQVNTWQSFDSQPDLSVASVSIEGLENLLSIQSVEPFWGEVISMSPFDVFSMSLGSDTPMEVPPQNADFVNLGPDQTLCPGESIVLDPGTGSGGVWQDGTNQNTFTVTQPGLYSVTVEGACGTGFDEVLITEGIVPSLDLPDEVFTCGKEEVLELTEEPEVDYLWNTGEEGSVVSISSPGTYTVTATSADGCITEASVEVISASAAEVNIDGPEFLCPDSTAILTASADQTGIFEWEGQVQGPDLMIDEDGVYSVLFTPDEGCTVEEAFEVDAAALPVVFASDTTICDGDEVSIVPTVFNGSAFWPGISESQIALISEPGIYEVVAENQCGSTGFQVAVDVFDCTCPVYVPNAFTPNGDGLNDLFVPEIKCSPEIFQLSIFNRWGTEVFYTTDPTDYWNGDSKNNEDYFLTEGVYHYVLRYDNPLRPLEDPIEAVGTVTLIR